MHDTTGSRVSKLLSDLRCISLKARTATAVAAVAALLVFSPGNAEAQDYRDIVRLGTSEALCEAIDTGADLQQFFRSNEHVVRAVLNDAQWQGNPDDLMNAVARGEFREASYPPGTRLLWMGRQVQGTPQASPYVRWAGRAPFEGFELEVTSECGVHTIVVPKICCNVSLFSVQPVPAPGSPALSVDAQCAGEPATITAASAHSVQMNLLQPDGGVSPLSVDTVGDRHTWRGVLDTPGTYQASATARDACGVSPEARAQFDLPECPLEEAARAAVMPFFGPFIGWERRTRDLCDCVDDVDSGLAGLLGGVLIPTGQHRTNVLLQVGGAANFDDSKWSSLFADVGMNFGVGERGFIGGGVGLWDINNSSMRDTTVFLQGGADAWQWGESTVQWFIDGRVFLDRDKVEDIKTNYAVLAGLRVLLGSARR